MAAPNDPFRQLEQASEAAIRAAQEVTRAQQEALFNVATEVNKAQVDMLRRAAEQVASAAETYRKAYEQALKGGKST